MPITPHLGFEGYMQNSFYFRCRACNRHLTNHSRRDKNGVIKESDLCSICTGLAFDDSPERVYQHQCITDVLVSNLVEDEQLTD
ncbi:hypothetical protein phAPEC8_00141 [Escherichia phage phAPEC8]|jgi:hypothetical protein|uniref:Uncharacterized protein n=4 Tax=Phapecoctavirus TaxID=2733124 RepID=A0A482N443_9CAUD|nr:hypothetical protein G377_gp267 [Escherichia phage phAPEC8]YP_009786593.1 hypothetical protein HOR21_gp131 [Escherichia phage ESCO13]YP_009823795.1 hypothetical protein HOV53_gp129 [Escherichia phage vB_EcoM_Schickermooser]AXA27944.1 hypothetical protein vBEcoMRo121lw_00129 [Escherichia phage vB_EcoM-Ro121lw]WPK30695.1 hypothetical protein ETECTG_CDS0180 [Escherichia phage ETEC-TG]AFU62843.1 hypothetical protein phAPEC8_00141 [Escherichia phage phAPEC8]AQM50957.1 hypothetical protein ESCO1